ncbi:MAG: SPOR domain-containing protein [Flavobacteriales bacterium]|nr:SPOR domain-containing protein [Flavobacteriales bacterium]
MLRLINLLLFGLLAIQMNGQGKIEVFADSALDKLILKRAEAVANHENLDTLMVRGYRLQIYFSNDRNKAYAVMEKAKRLFPEYASETYVIYQSPNYKVRVGNFIKETDSKETEKVLLNSFENVFLVRDKVVYYRNRPKVNDTEEDQN